ncbi:MAG: DNA adenine methylase [Gammaproteobacteria bacterium]|nr:DNA adenine methylase [Gammaproteobacteria bacterium]
MDNRDNPSPFTWPGGKYNLRKHILPHIQGSLMSPFLGGGAIELLHAQAGCDVVGFDVDECLIRSWTELLADAKGFVEQVRSYIPISRSIYKQLFDRMPYISGPEHWIVNRYCFSGLMGHSGGTSKGGSYLDSKLRKLETFESSIRVGLGSFEDTIPAYPDHFLYVDPPYVDQGFYRHHIIDHTLLRDLLREREGWLLSYADHPLVRSLYAGCHIEALTARHFRADRGRSPRVELLIRP